MEIVFSLSAAREIRKLEPNMRRRILLKLDEYRYKPALLEADLKRLEGTSDPVQYRLRAGDYRLIAVLEKDTVQILYVFHRSKAYK
jgi:mRNA-degrading endonuclease RelE of RelBE toxin-antitoxin system